MIDRPTSANYQDRDSTSETAWPCVVCGRAVKLNHKTWWVHVHNGGGSIVTEAEAVELNAAGQEMGDMGGQVIGPECLRMYPEIKAYAWRDRVKKGTP